MEKGLIRPRVVAGLALLASGLSATFAHGQTVANRPIDQRALFVAVGAMYELDPDLLAAIARAESGGAVDAVSPAGAEGLMQLMPGTARRFGVDHPFDPVESALGAAQYLDQLRMASPAGGQLPDLLAAYNAGEGAVRKYGGIPPYIETRQYVERVLRYYLLDAPVESRPVTKTSRPTIAVQLHAVHLPTPIKGERQVLDQLAELKSARAAALAEDLSH